MISNKRQIIGGLIYIIGLVLAFGFNGLAVVADLNGASFWGDNQDAMAFDHERPTQADLVNIRCPILMAPTEEGTITATFRNPNQQKADILVKVAVSKGDFANYRVVTGSLPIGSGEEQDFRWQVTGQDIIERNFILTRVFLMNQDASVPYPARTESCGIFVWSLFGLSGAALAVLMAVISFIGLLSGCVLLNRRDSHNQSSSPRVEYGLYGLAGIIVIGMVANLLGWWVFAGLLLALAVLLTFVLISNILFRTV